MAEGCEHDWVTLGNARGMPLHTHVCLKPADHIADHICACGARAVNVQYLDVSPAPDNSLYWEGFGDVRCTQCLDIGSKYETILDADLKIMGELMSAFARDFQCQCGRVVWDARSQTATITGRTP